jgi:rhomboid protease GlpG
MRMIGHVPGEAKARTFSDYLYALGIDNQVEVERDDSWAIWIHNEEHLPKAKSLLEQYLQNPAEPRFHETAAAAKDRREQERKEQIAYEKRLKERRHLFRPLTSYGFGPLTFVLIVTSVVIFILTGFGKNFNAMLPFYISEYDVRDGVMARLKYGLPEVRHGELWRLITPIFLHGDFLHIFFNMLWLRDLGSMIEGRQSSWLLAVQVIVFAVVSNLTQYLLSGPLFLGMSGVVYGLFGYIWIRGKRDPGSGLYLHPSTVTMMIIWFFVCFSGIVRAANGAHFGGLAAGIIWGYLSSLRHR